MGYYTQKAGDKSRIKGALFHAVYEGKTEAGREYVGFEFIKDRNVIKQIFMTDSSRGLYELCDFIRSIPIPETQITHIYKNKKQFHSYLRDLYHLFKEVEVPSLRVTRDGTPHGYDTFDLEISTSPSGWQTIKILNVISKVC